MHLGDDLGPRTLVGGSPTPHTQRAHTQAASSYLPLAAVDNQYHNYSDHYGSQGHQHAGLPVASKGTQLDCGVNVCPERHVENLQKPRETDDTHKTMKVRKVKGRRKLPVPSPRVNLTIN